MTRKGDLRWRPDFGLDIERVRHQGIKENTLAELQANVGEVVLKYEPRVEIVNIEVTQQSLDSTTVNVKVSWRAITQGSRRSTVLTDVETTEVEV
jgi:phage baseplate assembly protein W